VYLPALADTDRFERSVRLHEIQRKRARRFETDEERRRRPASRGDHDLSNRIADIVRNSFVDVVIVIGIRIEGCKRRVDPFRAIRAAADEKPLDVGKTTRARGRTAGDDDVARFADVERAVATLAYRSSSWSVAVMRATHVSSSKCKKRAFGTLA